MSYTLYERVQSIQSASSVPSLRATLPVELVNALIDDGILGEDKRETAIRYTIRGKTLSPRAGMIVRTVGEFRVHEKYGLQFEAESIVEVRPRSFDLITRYFEGASIPEISPPIVSTLLTNFGSNIYKALGTPESLVNVGIDAARAQSITQAWATFSAPHDLQAFLVDLNLSNEAPKIANRFDSPKEIEQFLTDARQDPYRLVDVGIEFPAIDSLLLSRGMSRESEERIIAASIAAYQEAYDNGNTALPQRLVESEIRKTTGLPPHVFAPILEAALAEKSRIESFALDGTRFVTLTSVYRQEREIAEALVNLLGGRSRSLTPITNDERAELVSEGYNAEQIKAVSNALSSPVSIITGGPGVGKTHTLRKTVELAQRRGAEIVLAAPIGKAALRMTQSTGFPASTVHSLLETTADGGFSKTVTIEQDLAMIDETSTMDMDMAHATFRALRSSQHLVLLGDVDQLRSIRAGNVLGDLIASGIIPVSKLTQFYRTTENSSIVPAAHAMNAGQMPTFDKDFFFSECDDDAIPGRVNHVIQRCLDQGFGIGEIMVLTPKRKGESIEDVSVNSLNPSIQEMINPPAGNKAEIAHYSGGRARIFREGDRVIYNANDKGRNLVNGSIGTIESIDRHDQSVTVNFDGKTTRLTRYSLYSLDLGYATTISRSIGDQYPIVIQTMTMRHKKMHSRKMVYTGGTRAQKKVVLVGDKSALEYAIKRDDELKRMTGLSAIFSAMRIELEMRPEMNRAKSIDPVEAVLSKS